MHALLSLLINIFRLIILPWLVFKRWRGIPKGMWVTLVADGSVRPIGPARRFWEAPDRSVDLHAVHRAAALASRDKRITGLFVELRGFQGGSASALALRNALFAWKAAGKSVVVHLPQGGGTRPLMAASAADRIVASPGSEIAPMGFAIEAPYVKGALAHLGLSAEVMAQGRYKTAGEFLVDDTMSAPQQEQVNRLLDVTWESLLRTLSEGRSVTSEQAKQWVDNGPWLASEAKELGIIDETLDMEDLLHELGTQEDIPPALPVARYLRHHKPLFRPLFRRPFIAVVQVQGTIVGDSPSPWLPVAIDEQIGEALTMARQDPHVKGVILFVDSRGGSASASERIFREVRKLGEQKPVVACLGDTAASGGYMVAAGAHAIVCEPTTITGSIGVVSARVIADQLLERVGIRMQTVKRGAHADMMTVSRGFEEGERASMERLMKKVYEQFVQAVAAGRGLDIEKVEALAQGRIWSGVDAAQHGLVDRLGGFEDALEEVRHRLGPGGERLEPVWVGPQQGPSWLGLLREKGMEMGGLGDLVTLSSLKQERVWAFCPWHIVDE
ncbi:MAG TPA: signal peptide peptidase SppA [Polyangiaceae bacterium]|nr:signal peptide peptidase SppA [Polyangiaceae bacterium]